MEASEVRLLEAASSPCQAVGTMTTHRQYEGHSGLDLVVAIASTPHIQWHTPEFQEEPKRFFEARAV
jgi:hypothetical protein